MALCFIRRKEDNVIVYGNSDITFVSNGLSGAEAGFTIQEATEEWGISATGWNDAEYDNSCLGSYRTRRLGSWFIQNYRNRRFKLSV
jgi:hypothetical protein